MVSEIFKGYRLQHMKRVWIGDGHSRVAVVVILLLVIWW